METLEGTMERPLVTGSNKCAGIILALALGVAGCKTTVGSDQQLYADVTHCVDWRYQDTLATKGFSQNRLEQDLRSALRECDVYVEAYMSSILPRILRAGQWSRYRPRAEGVVREDIKNQLLADMLPAFIDLDGGDA